MPLAIILLIVYFIFQLFGNGFEKSADNIVGIVDSAILGSNHMYLQGRQFVDPEGILSTIPAVSQVMIGFVCGKIIIDIKDNDRRMLNLFLIGTTNVYSKDRHSLTNIRQTTAWDLLWYYSLIGRDNTA